VTLFRCTVYSDWANLQFFLTWRRVVEVQESGRALSFGFLCALA
jgi:hypothetical protein